MRWPLVVIGCWIALAVVLGLTLPPLMVIAGQQGVVGLPDDAPVSVTGRDMSVAFEETGSDNTNTVYAILSNEDGLGPDDEKTYHTLVDTLRQDTQRVKSVQDVLSDAPEVREAFTSKDNKAWMLPINLVGAMGSPEARAAYKHLSEALKQAVTGSTLTANVTGPTATAADMTEVGERDVHLIEIGTGLMVLVILLIVYRSLVTMLLPLITIGISVVTAQFVVAGFAEMGLGISSEVIILMTGVMVGAGIDYAVFLISRYHDYVRHGADSDQAVTRALTSVGKVIAGSAATVAITFLAMYFSKLPVFAKVGPAIAISVVVAFVAAVTLLPALLALAGPRGWIRPRRELTKRFWRRSGVRIVRRPKIHLVGSLIVLILLASCVSLVHYNYDEREALPDSVDSAVGYAAMDRHFPLSMIMQEVLFIKSPHDLRSPEALADLEQMAQRVSQVPGIAMVRGLTRPTGGPLDEAKLSYQAGEVGGRLGDGGQKIRDRTSDLDELAGGAHQLAGGLSDVRGEVVGAVTIVKPLADALDQMATQLGGEKTLKEIDKTATLITSMQDLGRTLDENLANLESSFDWVDPVLNALNASPICQFDPACRNTRRELQAWAAARGNGTFEKIAEVADQLQSTQEAQTLNDTATDLRKGITSATSALRSLGLNEPGGLPNRLAKMQSGADLLADSSQRLADGVQQLVDQTKEMGVGLDQASGFLLAMKRGAVKPSMAGFFIPPEILTRDEFKTAAQVFMSPDGHAARYFVQTQLNPFSTASMDQINAIIAAARSAQPNTALEGAEISTTGLATGLRDTRDYYNHDIRFIFIATIIIVLLDPGRSPASHRCAAISDRFGDAFVLVGARHRHNRVPVHIRPAIALEYPRISLHPFGCGGCRLQFASYLADS